MCILITYNQFAKSVNIKFIYYCEQNKALLKLIIKHVKTCTQ